MSPAAETKPTIGVEDQGPVGGGAAGWGTQPQKLEKQ